MFRRNNVEKIIKKGHEYFQKGEYLQAKDMYLKGLSADPKNLTLLNNLAQIHKILGEPSKARGYNEILLNECDRILMLENDETALILKTNALLNLEEYEKLNETVDEILKINPKNILALFQKAQYLEMTGKNREAAKYLDKVLDDNNYDIIALLSKGRNLVELKEYEKAEECYNTVLKIETKNKAAINLKSQMLQKKYNISLTPHDLMLKAIENYEMENFKASQNYFKKAIDMNPNYDEIWFAQGELFIRMGKITEAIKSFKKAFEITPDSGGIVKKKGFFRMLNWMKRINKLLGYEK